MASNPLATVPVPQVPAEASARRGYGFVLAAVLCWSTSGTFIHIIRETYALSAWTLAFWRDFLTFVVLLTIALLHGPARLRVARRDLLPLAILGAVSIGIFHVLWNQAVVMIPVSVATVLNYTAPAFVVVFAWILWHERPNRRQALSLLLALVGCILVTGAYNLAQVQLNWLGAVMGLATGATFGLFTIISKHALKRYDSWTVLTYGFGFAALTVFILQPAEAGRIVGLQPGGWLWVLTLVLVSTVSGFALFASGLKYLSASTASISATLEPVIATGLAFVLLGQVIEPLQMVGGAFVIGAVILLAYGRNGPHESPR